MRKGITHIDNSLGTGRLPAVALVDTGIPGRTASLARRNRFRVQRNATFRVVRDRVAANGITHGSVCAEAILRECCAVSLYGVRVFDSRHCCDPRMVASAIRWSLRHGIDIINLSLGTTSTHYVRALEQACDMAAAEGVILVAPMKNREQVCYPACIPSVLSVIGVPTIAEHDLRLTGQKVPAIEGGIGIKVSSGRYYAGSSITCARVTGRIAQILYREGQRIPVAAILARLSSRRKTAKTRSPDNHR